MKMGFGAIKMVSMGSSERLGFETGLALLRGGHFFRAHEAFEDCFRAAAPPTRTLFHGLAQLAAAYHQLTLGRGRASLRTWCKARLKLESVGALPPGFAAEVDELYRRLQIDAEGPRFIDPGRLPSAQPFPVPVF